MPSRDSCTLRPPIPGEKASYLPRITETETTRTTTYTTYVANMGQSMSWLSSLLWAKKEIRILILGLVSSTYASSSSTTNPGPSLLMLRELGDLTTDLASHRITPERRLCCTD